MRACRAILLGVLIAGTNASARAQATEDPATGDPPTPAGPATLETAHSLRPVKTRHLRLSGDLDCTKLADAFGEELRRAVAAGAELVVLEMDGNAWRPDVARAMSRRLAESPVRTMAWLTDSRDKCVGLGQLVLALTCGDAFIAAGTRIVHTPSDDLRRLAPEDTEWDAIAADLISPIATRVESAGGDPRLGALLLAPEQSVWFVPSDGGAGVIEIEPPSGNQATRFVLANAAGAERIEITPALAISLRLVRGSSPTIAQALKGLGVRPSGSRGRANIESGLAEAGRRLEASMSDLRVALERIEETLRVTATKLDRRPLASDHRRAGAHALDQIESAERLLGAAEALTVDYPELLRDEAPTPAARRERVLSGFRRTLEDHRARAEEYRTRR